MKKIIAIGVAVCMLFSMSICAWAEGNAPMYAEIGFVEKDTEGRCFVHTKAGDFVLTITDETEIVTDWGKPIPKEELYEGEKMWVFMEVWLETYPAQGAPQKLVLLEHQTPYHQTPYEGEDITDASCYAPLSLIYSDWAKEYIGEAIREGWLVSGAFQGDFTRAITRGEFCELLWNLLKSEWDMPEIYFDTLPFSDITSEAVEQLYAKGIVSGMGDGTFRPNQTITREEAATVLSRLPHWIWPKNTAGSLCAPPYRDWEDISDWARGAVADVYLCNVLRGTENGQFIPKGEITVEQSVAALLRIKERLEMNEQWIALALAGGLTLSGCGSGTDATLGDAGSEPNHTHVLATANNVLEHESVGYCGNTVTTVRMVDETEGAENREASFWGGDSVELTDLLTYLDYSEETCDCMPEYTVKTEMEDGEYMISLSEGYARHNGKQVSLTQEQRETIREIIERQMTAQND